LKITDIFLILTFVLSGCVQSSNPNSQELNPVRQPTFGGLTNHNYTTPSDINFVLQGECDPNSYGLQYSYDDISWTQLSGGCPSNGKFSLTFNVNPLVNAYARAQSKTTVTGASHATVTLILPPTAPAFNFQVSSNSDPSGQLGTQNCIAYGVTADPMSNANNYLHNDITGIVYDGP